MTRGKFILVCDGKVYVSCEFNGDMYYEGGHGPEVVERLQRVIDLDSLKKEVTEFDKENFGYSKEDDGYFGIYDYDLADTSNKVDCKKSTYFDKWFSDYLYVKNGNDNTVTIIDYDKKEHNLNPGEIMVLNFGKPYILVDSEGTVISYEDEPEEDEDEDVGYIPEESNPFKDTSLTVTLTASEILSLYNNGFIPRNTTLDHLDIAIHDAIKSVKMV